MKYKIGQSHDIHRLEIKMNSILTIGLIKLSSKIKVIAESDGDILVHAIAESIIGALGKGDLGEHFKQSNQQKIIDGYDILNYVRQLLALEKYQIENIDALVIFDYIKLSVHRKTMVENIAKVLDIHPKQLNIKFTRAEKVLLANNTDFIQAQASCLISKQFN